MILKQSEQCDLWSGDYKCEITYLDGAGPACPVLQLLGRLVVVELPRWVRIYRGDTQVRAESRSLTGLDRLLHSVAFNNLKEL